MCHQLEVEGSSAGKTGLDLILESQLFQEGVSGQGKGVGGEQLTEIDAGQLVGSVAEQPPDRRACVGELLIEVHRPDDVGNGPSEEEKPLFALAQFLFGAAPPRYVAADRLDLEEHSVFVEKPVIDPFLPASEPIGTSGRGARLWRSAWQWRER